MAQLKDLLVNGDTRVAGKLLVDERSGGHFLTPIHFSSESLPSKTLQYVVGIDGFAEGGQAGWQSKAEFLSDVTSDITSIKNNYVKKAGDTMTGFLTLHANPTANLHAATKQYVDTSIENAAKLFTTTTTITTDTASSVVFDTSTVTLSTCLIYYNGLLMTPGVNYSITNNTTIALSGWTANKGDIFTVSGKQADETSVIAAGKLTCGTVGSSTKPVYFENGIPVECSKSIGEGYLPLSGGTITGTSGDTPLYLKSASTATWLGFKNSSGTNLGFFGFSGTNIPSVYLDKTYKLLHDGNYNSYSPTLTGGGASGTWNISISGNADTLDGFHENVFLKHRDVVTGSGATSHFNTPWYQIGIQSYHNGLPDGMADNATYYYGAVVSLPGSASRFDLWYNHQTSDNGDGLRYRTGWNDDKRSWATLLDNKNYSKFSPTLTGGGASGTWGINISGNAATATSATKATQDGNGATIASTYLKLSGGTMTGVISKAGGSSSWINGRDRALVRLSSYNAYSAITSMKTTNGAWEMGVYTNDNMWFTYTPDTNYNAGNNNGYTQIQISSAGALVVPVNTDYTTYKARNIASNTSALTSGSSGLSNGYIYLQYK